MTFELRPHPSKRPEYRSVMRNGHKVGYCMFGNKDPGPINLIIHVSEAERAQIREFVERECGPVSAVSMPPAQTKLPAWARRKAKIYQKRK